MNGNNDLSDMAKQTRSLNIAPLAYIDVKGDIERKDALEKKLEIAIKDTNLRLKDYGGAEELMKEVRSLSTPMIHTPKGLFLLGAKRGITESQKMCEMVFLEGKSVRIRCSSVFKKRRLKSKNKHSKSVCK